jgi:hypothetical protein
VLSAPSCRVITATRGRLDRGRATNHRVELGSYTIKRPQRVLFPAAATSNFFFAGVRTFTVLFIRGHYGLGQTAVTSAMGVLGLGALAGVVAGARLADALLGRGRLEARLLVRRPGDGRGGRAVNRAAVPRNPAPKMRPGGTLLLTGGSARTFSRESGMVTSYSPTSEPSRPGARSCAPACRSGASSDRPTSPFSPFTSWSTRPSPA